MLALKSARVAGAFQFTNGKRLGVRLVTPIDGSENAVDAPFGFGHGGFLPRCQSSQSRLRKKG